ncbi:MAG TPA: hypothetical protein VND68_05335, partial [Chloroflexia bacterium]|nr:hypothetical protein [Chloroflexia bacterium]
GPKGLPENFFQSTDAGYLLRRMVSTYISPLGLAYTGLLLVPICAVLTSSRNMARELPAWFRTAAFVALLATILFSITRGALLMMVLEFGLLMLLLRRRRTLVAGGIVAVTVVFILIEYVNFGPLLTFDLDEVRPPLGLAAVRQANTLASSQAGSPIVTAVASPTQKPGQSNSESNNAGEQGTKGGELVERMLTREDPSTRGHIEALRVGAIHVARYPLGTGLGSSVPRFGSAEGPAESALLAIFGEMGLLGGMLYTLMYGASIVYSFLAYRRVRGDPLSEGLALVPLVGGLALVPIMITSAIWGNFSVTFLFWWTAGLCLSLIREQQESRTPVANEERQEGQEATPKEPERDERTLALPHTV